TFPKACLTPPKILKHPDITMTLAAMTKTELNLPMRHHILINVVGCLALMITARLLLTKLSIHPFIMLYSANHSPRRGKNLSTKSVSLISSTKLPKDLLFSLKNNARMNDLHKRLNESSPSRLSSTKQVTSGKQGWQMKS